MARTVEPWVGKTDDAVPPPRVRLRVFDRCGGLCHMCGRKIQAGERWTLEHIVALINGGRNAEVNLGCTCSMCLPIKNAADVAEKSNVADIRKKHLGLKKSRHPMPCGRNSAFKKRMDGTVVPR